MYKLTDKWCLRHVKDDDAAFLADLYVNRRADLRLLDMDQVLLTNMIAMQQKIQMQGIKQNFPDALHLIVAGPDQLVGRIVIDVGDTDLRLIDMVISLHMQRKGIGRAILKALQGIATKRNIGMSLAVESANIPARNLYLDMGFVIHSADAMFEQMHWQETLEGALQLCSN